jgi:hypothetical protein
MQTAHTAAAATVDAAAALQLTAPAAQLRASSKLQVRHAAVTSSAVKVV